jgi:hypothetical protein
MKMTASALVIATLVSLAPAYAATAPVGSMTVRTFLAKVTKLKSLGPLALASGDLREVKDEARAAGMALKQDADARKAAGKPPLACPPKDTKMGGGEFLTALQSIPEAGRDIPLKQGFALVLAKRYPCAKKT